MSSGILRVPGGAGDVDTGTGEVVNVFSEVINATAGQHIAGVGDVPADVRLAIGVVRVLIADKDADTGAFHPPEPDDFGK